MKKILFLVITVLFFISSTAALSCIIPPDKYTFHCPEKSSCHENVSKTGTMGYEGINISAENKTNPGPVGGRQWGYISEIVNNRELPSAKEAKEKDKSLCPGQRSIHFYPKKVFQQDELKDTTECYENRIEELDNYYKVVREPTTEPLLCRKKHEETAVSGGEKSWVEPVDLTDVNFGKLILDLIL